MTWTWKTSSPNYNDDARSMDTWSSHLSNEYSFSGCNNSRESSEMMLLESCSFGEKNGLAPRNIRSSFCKPHHEARKNQGTEELTLDKLRYRDLAARIFGRDTEIAILGQALECLIASSQIQNRDRNMSVLGQSQLVLISGYQGTGKSKLAFTLHPTVKSFNGLFGYGRFDSQRDEPYYGITSACRYLCAELLQLKKSKSTTHRFERLRCRLFESLQDELPLLTNLIPELNDILDGECVGERRSNEDPNQNLEFAKNRMNFALVRFIGLLSRHFGPLVLVFDDLQWGDESSLSMLELLLTDAGSKLMIVGCYRSNEVANAALLQSKLSVLKEKESTGDFQTSSLVVGNLDEDSSHQMVMALLGTDDSTTKELAKIAHRKSAGNAFFLVSFLTLLYEEKLLHFNLGTLQWKWDAVAINDSTRATANVVDLIQRKLDALPSIQKRSLVFCSFLGPSFGKHAFSLIWQLDDHKPSNDFCGLDELLQQSVRDGILEISESQRYRFVHDKVRECVQLIVDIKEAEAMRLHVGDTLASVIDDVEYEDIFFVGLNMMNQGAERYQCSKDLLRLAELNLKAAKRVLDLSGFEIAATYVEKGIVVLPTERWETSYDLTLELFTIGAESCAVIGKIFMLEIYCEEILKNARTMDDKLRMYFIKMDSLTRQTRFDEAVQLGLKVLKEYNYRFPKSSTHRVLSVLVGLARSKNRANVLATKDVASANILQDKRALGTMRILYKLCRCAYLSKSPLLPLVALEILKESERYGATEYTAPSHALMAVMLTGLAKDFEAGTKHAEHALQLVNRLDNKRMSAGTYAMCYGLVFPWTRPLKSMLRPLVNGYERGLEVGDAENAMWCIVLYLNLSFHAGRPLESLDADARMYSRQIQEFKREECTPFLKIPWQAWQNYMTGEDDPLLLCGNAIGEQEMLAMTNGANTDVVRALTSSNKQALAAIFGEHERGAALALSRTDDMAGQFAGSVDCFYRGLCLYAMARKRKTRRFIKEARRQRKILKGFVKKGNVNLLHLEALLDAEAAALKKNHQSAKKHWESAILLSRGFLHHTALACERYGEFLLLEMKDPVDAAFRISQAISGYQEWGSMAKVHKLSSKYGDLISSTPNFESSVPLTILASSGHKDIPERRISFQ